MATEAVSSSVSAGTSSSLDATHAVPSAVAALQAAEQTPSTFGFLARAILTVLRVLPGTLYWIITFTTITLPTWLFTLFSMSLTFTMNFTTL
jgi:lysophospholipid hydrolase